MNIILLSGGSGKRLWPLSNEIRSKQFLKIFKKDDNTYESMIQSVYSKLKALNKSVSITIATSKSQVSSINNQLDTDANICIEPCRRDTFPAIVLASEYISSVLKADRNEIIIVCPVDPYVDSDYFKEVLELENIARNDNYNLTLMGIEPTYPSEKYGYIIPEYKAQISPVREFKEKPDAQTAQKYIDKGALWNSGVFAFKLGYLIDKSHDLIDYTDYNDLYNKYEDLASISFDYVVVEKEPNIQVKRFSGKWKDLGTWNTLSEALDESTIGNAVLNETCENVHVVNELDVPVLCMGLKNIVVSASPDGILVSDKEQSSYIKPFVDQFNQQIMYADKSWGSYKVLDIGKESLTIRVELMPGHKMKYHSHSHRNEIWNIIEGKGLVKINGDKKYVQSGDIISIPAESKHTILAESKLVLIEVQLGKDISLKDKVVFDSS